MAESSIIDDILTKVGLKYEDLKPAEKETLYGWVEALKTKEMSVQDIREYVSSLKYNIESELTKPDNSPTDDIFLKARLRNIMLLEAFLSSHDRAKSALEKQLKALSVNRLK